MSYVRARDLGGPKVATAVVDLQGQVMRLTARVASLETQVVALQNAMAAHAVDVTTLQETIAPLDSAVNALGELKPSKAAKTVKKATRTKRKTES